MYVITEGQRGLIVDPHSSEEVFSLLRRDGIKECTVLLTHEHPDHTCGLHALQNLFKVNIICQKDCAKAIADRSNNRPTIITAMLSVQDSRNGTHNAEAFLRSYKEDIYFADIVFGTKYVYQWGSEHFVFMHTPGHSKGSSCILWNNAVVFTGDSLLCDMPVLTRLPGGNTKLYRTVTQPFLNSLNKKILALPGHGLEFRLGDI